ncbi:MAG: ribosome biogenesis GTPase Der [Gammaproteobacteria bacterium]|jgi:GTP-binding protein|nr:ribosome biogenesis GTPase Der [Gammaproteobacteria bacterium]
MLPVVVLVGRPNVGKSTLFNRLTGTRDAIVADMPGVTRDRQYGYGKLGPVPYVVVDTGGLVEQPSGIETPMRLQTERAIEEADVLVFLADARSGLTPQDHWVVRELRRSGKKVVLAVNKAEGLDPATAAADFHSLGLGEPMAIASAHGDGCRELMSRVLEDFDPEVIAAESSPNDGRIRIAIIGRPNVGKSTLVNRLIGEERVIASDMPGTTRDSIFVPFARDEREFTLIDTAGVRRRGKIDDDIEKASVAKTLQAIDTAHVVIFVVDAHDSIGEQDANVLGLALQRGRALIIAVNKWDGIPMEQRDEIRRLLELKLDFVPYAPVHFISARHGTGVGELVAATIKAYDAAMTEIPTPKLTKTLERAMVQHQPPLVRGRRIKLRYAHQGGRNPPRIIVHGNQTVHVPEAYTRYLANVFRREFDLFASPVAIEYRTDSNPYARSRGRPRPQTASEKRATAKERAQKARKGGTGKSSKRAR